MRIAVRPCHTVPPHQQVPSAWTRLDHPLRGLAASPKDTSTWFSTTSFRISQPAAASCSGEATCVATVALDHLGQAGAPERTQRRPDLHAAGAPRQLRREVGRVALGAGRRQVLRGDRHGRRQRTGFAHEGEAAVVGHVEPLVRVGRPRVRLLHAARPGGASCGAAAAHRPKAPSTCTQAPGVPRAGDRSRANGSNAPVLTLPACRQTIVGPERRGNRSARIAALPVHRHAHDAIARPSPSSPSDLTSVGMRLLAHDHGDAAAHRTARPPRRSSRRAPAPRAAPPRAR